MFKREVCLSFQSQKPSRSQDGARSVKSQCCSALSGFVSFFSYTCCWVKFTELCPEMNPVCKLTLFLRCRGRKQASVLYLPICLSASVCVSIVGCSPCSFALGEGPKLELRRWREMKGRHIMTDLMTFIWIGFLCCGLPSTKRLHDLSFSSKKIYRIESRCTIS